MEIDAIEAAALGWPKTKYAGLERERRWICNYVPADLIVQSSRIADRYISGTQLRLREVRDIFTGSVQRKLTRKADLSSEKRIITTIYLSQDEFTLLCGLPAHRIEKTRHSVIGVDGVALALDQFSGGLSELSLVEVDFATDEEMNGYAPPEFMGREVTGDVRFTGAMLARAGVPR